MKKLFLLLLLLITMTGFSQTSNDTITNWQVYKDGQLLFKSNSADSNRFTATIKSSEKFTNLKIIINSDIRIGETTRKILFKQNGKLIYTYQCLLKSNTDPVIISYEHFKRIIGPSINEVFEMEYTDTRDTNGIMLGKIVLISE